MKKLLVTFIALLFAIYSYAQLFDGVHSSRYFPLQNIYTQPSDLVFSDYKWNINLFSPQISLVNNMVFNESDFIKTLGRVGFNDLKYFFASEQTLLLARGRILLPSVSYKINPKHSVAFSTNLRVDGIYRSSNDEITNLFKGYDDPDLLEDMADEYFKSVVNQWMEYSFSWSGIIWHQGAHTISGGANIKYLVGGGSGYVDLDGIKVMYGKEKIDYFKVDVSYAINKNLRETIDDGKIDLFGDNGLGFDMGFTYRYKPEGSVNIPYKYKLGFLVGDWGYVKHKDDVRRSTFRVAIDDVPYSRFSGVESIEALVDSLQKSVSIEEINSKAYTMKLPTNFVLSGDYCFHPNWYVNGLLSYQPGFYHNLLSVVNRNIWKVNITPRFENKTWGAYLPITYSSIASKVGLSLRWKYLFMGSSTFVSNLIKEEKGRGEFYFGFNIPIGKLDVSK
nr:DUF5723 family protein [uncultured Carboxylicivirga sp.]